MVDMQTWFGIQQLYADYAIAVDSGNWDLWPEFFTEKCVYKLQPRENHERVTLWLLCLSPAKAC